MSNLIDRVKKMTLISGRRVPELLEKIDLLLEEPEQAESILVLASKLATFAAENARKRNLEAKNQIGKNRD